VSRIFLGKWWHWGILVASVAALWFAGQQRMHVIHFNAFILSLLVVTAIVIAFLIARTHPGEQVTRDRLDSRAAHLRTEER
jgi:hypothetical protein